MIAVDVRSNISQVRAKFSATARDIEEKAVVRALNRAGDQSITEARRRIRDTYNIKASALSRQIRIRARASKGKPTFSFRVFGRRIPIIEFNARQNRRGVSFTVKKGQRKTIQGAFVATMKSGHIGVFARAQSQKLDPVFRRGKGSRTKSRGNDLKIAELFTLDVPTMFLERRVIKAVMDRAIESFNRNFQQQLQFLSGS